MKRRNYFFIILQIIFITFSNQTQALDLSDLPNVEVLIKQSIPDGSFKDKDGNDVSLEQFKGKPIILNFWATWCAPCVKEMPALTKLQQELEPKNGMQLIAISEDFGGIDKAIAFLDKNKLQNITPYHDPKSKFINKFNQNGLPATFLIDKDGNIKAKLVGIIDWQDKNIKQILLALF